MNERLEHNDLRRPQSGSHGFSQREGRDYSSHNKQKAGDVYNPREESNPGDRPLSREKSYPPNVSAGYPRTYERRSPSRNLGNRPRESEQTAEDMSKTQSGGSREGPRAKPRAWDEYLRKNTEEETGYSSHSKQSSAGVKRTGDVYNPPEVSNPRERDNAYRSRLVNSNTSEPNAGHSRFHRHASPNRKSDEAQKSDRIRTEHHNKHGESQQTAGNSSNAQSSGSQGLRQAKPQAWEEFLRKKREEEAKVSQRSQRTKDYADERNKAIKGDSKPTKDSGDKVDEPEGKQF